MELPHDESARSVIVARAGTSVPAVSLGPPVRGLVRADTAARAERRLLAYATAFVAGLHALPRLVLGTRSYVSIHDNLETDVLYRALIARGQRMFASGGQIDELLGGLPRWDYPSAFKFSSLLFWLLPSFWAYAVLEAFVRAVAVLGMGLLLRDYVPASRTHRIAIAVTFGILPFYSIYDLSVAGEPLVAWALLNLWNDKRVYASLAVCAAFPFASVLWTGPPFFLALAGMCLVAAAVHRRRVPLRALAGLLVVALGYLVADQHYLAGLLRADFVSHRAAWRASKGPFGIGDAVHKTLTMFFQGAFHAASLHTPILIATLLLAPVLFARGFRREGYVLCLIVVISALFALSTEVPAMDALAPLYAHAPALRQINVRFWWTLPLLWYVALAVLCVYWPKTGLRPGALNLLLAFQFVWVFASPRLFNQRRTVEPELRTNYVMLARTLVGKKTDVLSYEQFLSVPAFDQIRKHIGSDTGRFLTLGMHVASAAYNGFPSVDGLHDNYPLSYKQRFRRLIAPELEQDAGYRDYFDGWGGRAYVLLHGVKLSDYDLPQARPPRVLRELALDQAALHDLGVKWIVSAFVLEGAGHPAYLSDEGTYGDPDAGYVLRLYRVRDDAGTRLALERR